jgi:hypothetical protein
MCPACLRGHLTAGHDVIRETAPDQFNDLLGHDLLWVLPFRGMTGRHHAFIALATGCPRYRFSDGLCHRVAVGVALQHIQPGKPQQNAYVERYNRTVRHEWLDQYIFETIQEVQDYATDWLWTYNHDRPNMGIGGITPAQKLKLAA